jgi:hypothetical protein
MNSNTTRPIIRTEINEKAKATEQIEKICSRKVLYEKR